MPTHPPSSHLSRERFSAPSHFPYAAALSRHDNSVPTTVRMPLSMVPWSCRRRPRHACCHRRTRRTRSPHHRSAHPAPVCPAGTGAHPSPGTVPAHDARRGSERRSPDLSLASITASAPPRCSSHCRKRCDRPSPVAATTHRAGAAAATARVNSRWAQPILVAKRPAFGTPASVRRPRSVLHSRGRARARSMKAAPRSDA